MAKELRTSLEAVRGALIAAHSASGLLLGCRGPREGLRLTRAAEGLLRAAAAVLGSTATVGLGSSGPVDAAGTAAGAAAKQGTSRSAKRRQRRRRAVEEEEEGKTATMNVDAGLVDPTGAKVEELAGYAVGDLSEFGGTASVMAVSALPPPADEGGGRKLGRRSSGSASSAAAALPSASTGPAGRQKSGAHSAPWCSCGQKNTKSAWFCVSCGSQLV